MYFPIKTSFLKSVLAFGCLMFCITFLNAQPFKCTIKGTVSDTSFTELKIETFRKKVNDSVFVVPIKNGEFLYTFQFEELEAYTINFRIPNTSNEWFLPFFPIDGEISFSLFPFEFDGYYLINKIEGGQINQAFMAYGEKVGTQFNNQIDQLYNRWDSLEEAGNFYNDSALVLNQKMKNGSTEDFYRKNWILKKMRVNHEDKTPEGKILALKIDSLQNARYTFTSNYIKHNHNTLSYYLLLRNVTNKNLLKSHFEDIQQNFKLLSPKFPDHSYTPFIEEILISFKRIQVGKEFLDFTAPDLNGNPVTLSDKLEGKITLLDLWGSWCGGCITTSKLVVPIYEAYKDKGFNVIGVAREFKNTDALERILGKVKFPWLNLLELDDQQDLWLKYGIPNSGGEKILIDRDGKILAISPGPDEIKKILEEKL
ncbi:MAG: TlpA family protein disulfide reductase [Flammeovirgaceae bacterium]|nr:TlpA family protein disulfide reductase [Flammeovirgaceae bacterium]